MCGVSNRALPECQRNCENIPFWVASCDVKSAGVLLLTAGILVVDAVPTGRFRGMDFAHLSENFTAQSRADMIANGKDGVGVIWVALSY